MDDPDQTNRSLQLANAKLRALFHQSSYFSGVLDRNGDLIEINDAALREFGLTSEQVVGQPFWQTPWWDTHGDSQRKLQANLKIPLAGEIYRETLSYRLPDGTTGFTDFRYTPARDDDGAVMFVVCTGSDVTESVKTQRDLAEAQSRIEMAMSASQMGLWRWHVKTNATVSDPSLREMFGLSDIENPTIEQFLSRVVVNDRDDLIRSIELATRSGDRFDVVYRVIKRNGDVRWFNIRGRAALDADGQPVDFIGIVVDVTQQRDQERRIRAGEERLRLVLQAASVSLWQWNVEVDLFEWSSVSNDPDLSGEISPIGNLEQFLKRIYRSDRSRVRKSLQRCLRNARPFRCEYRIRRKESQNEWVLAIGRLSQQGIDSPVQIIAIEVDISERKRNELQSRLSEERLRIAVDAAGLGMLHVDLMNQKVTLSKEFKRIIGADKNQFNDLKLGDMPSFIHRNDAHRVRPFFTGAIRCTNEEVLSIDVRVIRSDQQTRWVRLDTKTLSVIENGRRKPTQMIGAIIDIHDQRMYEQSIREAQARAEAASESKSAFLANMSHEIRTPMTSILGYTELVEELIDEPLASEHLRTIRRNGAFLLEIINDILDLSKIEAGKFAIIEEGFSLRAMIDEVRSIMEIRAADRDIDLKITYKHPIPSRIQSDSKRLKQILINLVGNAIKFTPQGSVEMIVDHRTEDSSWKVQFDIIDTGIGMNQAQLERLFRPFSQGDETVSRKFGGTGLGLAISKRLTEMLGGELSVVSQLGQGSTFTATIESPILPGVMLIDAAADVVSVATPGNSRIPKLRCRVLVVDDSRDIRFVTRHFLSQAGATVSEAEDGEQAVDAVTESIGAGTTFRVILLDMQMPRLDGYQTAQTLRQMGYTGSIIALTADAMQGDMKRCLQCGCNDYLSKPIDKKLLLKMVARHTGTRDGDHLP